MTSMSDHAIIMICLAVIFVVGAVGLIVMSRMLHESQRMTRAVAGLVYQESDRIRALMGR